MVLLGIIVDAIWVPIALVLTLFWLIGILVECCKMCCGKKNKSVEPMPTDGGLPDDKPADIEKGDNTAVDVTPNKHDNSQTVKPGSF